MFPPGQAPHARNNRKKDKTIAERVCKKKPEAAVDLSLDRKDSNGDYDCVQYRPFRPGK
jgi:hypothetical protein